MSTAKNTDTVSHSKHPESLPVLLDSLRHLAVAEPKAVKANVHLYPPYVYANNGEGSGTAGDGALRERRITSWKMTEHMYFKKDNVFPTLARGLFTETVEKGDPVPAELEGTGRDGKKPTDRIVARGYDKFFNIDEIAWTEWQAMKANTAPPYHLTLKSNGCLILISALSPTHLVVASKHSLGTTTEDKAESSKKGSGGKAAKADEGQKVVPGASGSGDGPAPAAEPAPAPAPEPAQQEDPAKDPTDSLTDATALLSLSPPATGSPEMSKKEKKRAAKKQEKELKKQQHKELEAIEGRNKAERRAKLAQQAEENQEHQEAQAHAEVGRRWVRRTLEKVGKTEADLARRLWDGNMTAVLELCDDSFEEHVIATPTYWTGLHLHGLNHNTPHFSTAPPADVTAFAHEFGFIETKFVVFQTLDEVKSFTDGVAKTGAWEGDMIEGFVVRCKVRDVAAEAAASGRALTSVEARGRPPYRPGAPFFFKVKFDEPYMLYRQWRETTRKLLPLLEHPEQKRVEEIWKTVRARCKRPEMSVYADWCGEMMKKEPELFRDYDKGVVRVRERFLAWTEGEGKQKYEEAKAGKGGKPSKTQKEVDEAKEKMPKKWLLVPAAVPGCGKTMLGVALTRLFGFAHTQSDDVTAKRTAPTFLRNIVDLFKKNDVVFADRCNHISKHYDELSALSSEKSLQTSNLRSIAITWDLDTQPYHRLLRVCSERVVVRGDNHATLRPDPSVDAEHEAVVSRFLRDYVPPDPAAYDAVIQLSVLDTPGETLRKLVDGLVEPMGLPRPDDAALEEALAAANSYKVTTPYHAIPRVGRTVRYFGLAPEMDLAEVVAQALEPFRGTLKGDDAVRFLEGLKAKGRVTGKPHVTLCHENNVKLEKVANGRAVPATDGAEGDEKKEVTEPSGDIPPPGPQEILWETCKSLSTARFSPLFKYDLTHLVWDSRAMAFALDRMVPIPSPLASGEETPEVPDLDKVLPDEARMYLHVTVGTTSEDIPAYESRGLIKAVRGELKEGREEGEMEEVVPGGGAVRWVKIGEMKGEGRVRGMF
ncbi:hypothetical protein IAT38_002785 [Cryptococcus sp. DSM 104549]